MWISLLRFDEFIHLLQILFKQRVEAPNLYTFCVKSMLNSRTEYEYHLIKFRFDSGKTIIMISPWVLFRYPIRCLPDSKVRVANMGLPGSWRPHVGPTLAPWILLSQSLEAARFVFRIIQLFWNFTSASATLLPMYLSNFEATLLFKQVISWLRDLKRFYD